MTPNEKEGKSANASLPEAEELVEDRALWELLGSARRPEAPSPYFTRRVLREVAFREEEAAERFDQDGGGWWGRFFAASGWRLRVAAAAAGIVLALRMSSLERNGHGASLAQTSEIAGDGDTLGLVPEAISDRDLAVIADLDDLLENQENRVWLEDDSTS